MRPTQPSSDTAACLTLGSSLRSVPAAGTLARARPLMARLGITRLTDITRMDRLGLPVFIAVRPRGQVLRVHAGKGLLAAEARVGALMEALEFAVAEPLAEDRRLLTLPLAALRARLAPRLRWEELAPLSEAPPGLPVPTISCEDLLDGGCTVPVPAELVFAGPVAPLFGPSSNGLASGNTLAEATLHALLEVLERDAQAMNVARDDTRRVDERTLPAPFPALARAWRETGVELAVRGLPNDFGLPCFEAFLAEPAHANRVNLATGSGLHPLPRIALARAICEAAQSRLSVIHGGREDVTGFYAKYADASGGHADAELHAAVFDTSRLQAFDDEPGTPPFTSIEGLLDTLLQRLRTLGFRSVLRHRFAADLDGLHVVRVIVPGCAPGLSDPPRMTPRLLARVLGRG